MFQLANQESFLTTVGKLNFFRWAIEKGILDYIKLNLAKIEKEMNTNARELQKVKKSSEKSQGTASTTRRRRETTTMPVAKVMEKHEVPIEIRFD